MSVDDGQIVPRLRSRKMSKTGRRSQTTQEVGHDDHAGHMVPKIHMQGKMGAGVIGSNKMKKTSYEQKLLQAQ